MIMIFTLTILTGCGQTTPTAAVPPTAANTVYPPPSSSQTIASVYPPLPTPETGTSYPAQGGNGLQVVASDGTSKTVSWADLNDLPKATVGSESGPKLIDVLQFAGNFDFSTITVTGSNGTKDLTKDQVNDQVILSLGNGTVSLVIGGAPSDQLIKDITLINVK